MVDYVSRVAEARICTTCGTQDIPKTHVRGSFGIEVVLWLCFLLPGLIYSVWRLTTKQQVCRSCGASNLVPIDSPVGRQIADRKL